MGKSITDHQKYKRDLSVALFFNERMKQTVEYCSPSVNPSILLAMKSLYREFPYITIQIHVPLGLQICVHWSRDSFLRLSRFADDRAVCVCILLSRYIIVSFDEPRVWVLLSSRRFMSRKCKQWYHVSAGVRTYHLKRIKASCFRRSLRGTRFAILSVRLCLNCTKIAVTCDHGQSCRNFWNNEPSIWSGDFFYATETSTVIVMRILASREDMDIACRGECPLAALNSRVNDLAPCIAASKPPDPCNFCAVVPHRRRLSSATHFFRLIRTLNRYGEFPRRPRKSPDVSGETRPWIYVPRNFLFALFPRKWPASCHHKSNNVRRRWHLIPRARNIAVS